MKNRFYFARSLIVACCGIFLMYLVVMIIVSISNGRFSQSIPIFLVIGSLIVLFWVSITSGTYITVENNKVFGKVFFIRGRVTPLSNIVSIHKRPTFGGLMAEIYMKVRNKEDKIVERGLTNIPSLKNDDFRKLLEIICSKNPNIDIDPDVITNK